VVELQSNLMVLNYLQRLLATPLAEVPPLDGLLNDTARAFGVAGAGVTGPLEGQPRVERRVRREGASAASAGWPWKQPRELAESLRSGASTQETVGSDGESLLISAAPMLDGRTRLLWIEEPAGRVWNDAEKAALLLAGQVLGRRIPAEAPASSSLPTLDQNHLQQRLLDAAVMSGRIAHAFDNVLTGILGFTELTLSMATDATLQQYLGEVLQAAQSGIQLTQQLHLFNRCAASGAGPVRLCMVVTEEEVRLRQALDEKIELNIDVPGDLPAVGLEAEPLRQVLCQLLDNARESLAGAGTISLSAQKAEIDAATCAGLYGRPQPGECIEVIVADTGGGLGADARQRLFRDPFFSTKPRHRGLGLAIVYRILHAHHGGLQLEASPRGGTRARVFLPLASAPASPPGQRRLSALSP
jgi:signal transduction histidine kinase